MNDEKKPEIVEACLSVECQCGEDFAVRKRGLREKDGQLKGEKWAGLDDETPPGMERYWNCPGCWKKHHASFLRARAVRDVVRDNARWEQPAPEMSFP